MRLSAPREGLMHGATPRARDRFAEEQVSGEISRPRLHNSQMETHRALTQRRGRLARALSSAGTASYLSC